MVRFKAAHGIRPPSLGEDTLCDPYAELEDFDPADVTDATDDRILKIGDTMYVGQTDWNK